MKYICVGPGVEPMNNQTRPSVTRRMNKSNPFYTEIKTTIRVSPAESTMAWFCSGRKQGIVDNEIRNPVYTDGVYDCAAALQRAIDLTGVVHLPAGHYHMPPSIVRGQS